MKKACLAIGIITAAVVTLSSAYYFSYKKTLEHYKEQQDAKANEEPLKEEFPLSEPIAKAADTVKEEVLRSDTIYRLITLEVRDNAYAEENVPLPAEWIGYNREALTAWLNDYMKELSYDELRAGLLSFELQSFSSNEIVLKKTYDKEKMPYEFFLGLVNNEVVVFYCDKKTVYEYTGIDTSILPKDEIDKLTKGIYVSGPEELYGILENYSS